MNKYDPVIIFNINLPNKYIFKQKSLHSMLKCHPKKIRTVSLSKVKNNLRFLHFIVLKKDSPQT